MTDEESLDRERAAGRYLIQQYRETGQERFLLAAAQLRGGSILTRPRGRGRPEIPGEHGRLLRMALLLDRRLAANPTAAARLIAQEEPEQQRAGIVDRLRKKFAGDRAYFMELVAVLRSLEGPTPEVQALTAALRQDEQRRERLARAIGRGGNSRI